MESKVSRRGEGSERKVYTWLFFDADRTLFDYDTAERKALGAALAEEGISVSAEHLDVYRTVNEALWRRFELGGVTQDTVRVERFRQFAKRFEMTFDPAEFSDRYVKRLSERADLIEDAEDVIRALHGTVGLLLLTNGMPEVQRPRVANSPLRNLFQHVVISEEVGAAKPDRRIFEFAMQSAGYPSASQVLMVGDSLSSDIEGAVRYGIDSCWFNPSGKKNDTSFRPTYEIGTLRELIPLLKGNTG